MLNQALALEYVKLKRQEQEPEPSKSSWRSILQSVAPTIITVVIGGILGGAIADHIQETNRQNDERRAWQQANLADEQKTVDQAFATIGKTVSASQDLIDITGEGFDENAPGLATDERKDLAAQKRAIWQTYNSATAAWRGDRERLGMLLAIRYEKQQDEIKVAWHNASHAMDDFADCTLTYNKEAHQPVPHERLKDACKNKRAALDGSLYSLTKLTVEARTDLELQGSRKPDQGWWHFW